MSIWTDLTKPDSFAGEYETAIEAPPSVDKVRRFSSPPAPIDKKESLIGVGLVIEGKIVGDGDIRLAGCLKGDLQVKGTVAIESGARVVGPIRAESITIAGEIEGNVAAVSHVKLLETGQLVGDLKAKFLTVAAGSRMRGRVEFGWDEPKSKENENKKPGVKTETSAVVNEDQPRPGGGEQEKSPV